DLLAVAAADRGAFDPVTGDQAVGLALHRVGLHGCLPLLASVDRANAHAAPNVPPPPADQNSGATWPTWNGPRKTVPSANRTGNRHGRLPCEQLPWAGRGDGAGGFLPRDPAEPGDQPIERADRGTDLSFRHDAFDVEHLQHFLDADDGDLQVAVEAA